MIEAYVKLGVAALLPVLLTVVLLVLERYTKFKKLPYAVKQIFFGICFGALAIIGTEWGIPVPGAQVNCRDAAVITVGLLFGGPAGIIAGVIGGAERWIAVAWGIGSFTRVACSVSTVMAGLYAAALRKFMFDNKMPGWLISGAAGVVMEVVHLTMVFLTNMSSPNEAMAVVAACGIPMIVANGLSVLLSAAAATLLLREKTTHKGKSDVRISQTIQRWLLVTVVLAFAVTSFFVLRLQNEIAKTQENRLLTMALSETESDIRDMSNYNLIALAHKIAKELDTDELTAIAAKYDVAEINAVGRDGIIYDSTQPEFIGYDMASGEQSEEFLCLVRNRVEFAQDYGPISYNKDIYRKYAGVQTVRGFVQVGYDAKRFQKDIDADIVDITKNRHVGENGFILIMDKECAVVSAPDSVQRTSLSRELFKIKLPGEGVTFNATISNVNYDVRYCNVEGYTVMAFLPVEEIMQTRNVAMYVNSFMEIIVFAVLFALIYMLIKRVVVNQIKQINASLNKITGGNLDEVVNVRSNEEFANLSDDINQTVGTLKRYIAEASARIDAELEFAKNIQASALPSVFPAFPKRKDFDVFASMDPAKEVGGDFYDFYFTNNDVFSFLVADVSGKGIPAAMFMMSAKTELKSLSEAQMPICDVFTHGNEALCSGNDAGMFVTAWEGQLDLNTGLLQYANAGHNPPLLRRKDGKFEYLRGRAGFVLAGMDGVRYKTQEVQLERGDIIFLYTDGVTEATNADNVLYGEERLAAALNAKEFDNVREMCEYVKADVDAFVGEAPQFDDITMLAVKYIGKKLHPAIHYDNAAIADIPAVTEFVEGELEKLDCPMKAVVQISVAIDEIYSNIVNHGYKGTTGPVTVKVISKEEPKAVCIRFEDQGVPYNPLTRQDPDVTLSAEERSIGGLGIYMVKKTMDDIKYKYENGQNILTIRKNLE